MKHTFLFSFLICLAMTVFSQEEKNAIGIRGGLSSGFEYRVFTDAQNSYKLLLSYRMNGLQLTGMKEFHELDVFDIGEKLSFVYGLGAHLGFESWDRFYNYDYYPYARFRERKSGLIAGLDGLAALEYTIPELPIVAGIEVKPYFNLFGENFLQLRPFDFAFTLKYVF